MAKIDQYRKDLQEILLEYGTYLNQARGIAENEQFEIQTIFDTVRDPYQLVHVGFANRQRQYGCLFHADIKNEKIWIQHNSTDLAIGDDLLARGVPKSDIVLGFYSPEMRRFSEYAIN